MKRVRITIAEWNRETRLVIEEVEGEPQIRHEDQPIITRDREVFTPYGRVKVEKLS